MPDAVLALALMAARHHCLGTCDPVVHVPTFVLPAPSAIVRIPDRKPRASSPVPPSRRRWRSSLGFVLAAITGIAIALVIVRFERFGRALYPLIVLFQNVPKVALAPIFILWFGFDLAPKMVLIVVIAFFPVAIDMLAGLQSVEPSFVALMQSVGASRGKILLRVRIPHSLPHLMAGLKVAITFSVIGAIVGEFAGANQGLGYRHRVRLDPARYAADLRGAGRRFGAGTCLLLRRRARGAPAGSLGSQIRRTHSPDS